MSLRFHIPRLRELSVVTFVVVSLVTLTTAVLAIFAVANYRSERKALWKQTVALARLDADQLAEALTLPVWNFDRPQIERVVESIMRDEIIVGVVLQEEDGRRAKTTWARGDDGQIKPTERDFAADGYLREVREVRTMPGTALANVQLYATTKFFEENIRRSLIMTIGRILVVDLVLTIGSFWLLRCWVFAPLQAVEVFARAVSSGEATDSVMATRKFRGELESLRHSIQTTLSQLELRLREKNRAQSALRREADFDELLTRVMARFVSATASEIDAQVAQSLREIATFIGVESGIVVQILQDGNAWGVTHDWCAPGFPNPAEHFKYMPMGSSEWIEQRIFANEPVVVTSIRDLPQEAVPVRERWERYGFKALLTVPMRARGGYIRGAIALISLSRELDWQQADVAQLRIASEAIGNTLERKRAEESVLQSREQLRALTGRLQSLREEERTRLSREIHDHLGQLLTALKLDLKLVEKRVGALQETDAKQAASAKLNSAQQLADETLLSVQKIASELRPGILDKLGLAAAIQSEALAFESRTGVRCDPNVSKEPVSLPQEHATAAFRIFQELLTNIARHAKAKHTSVNLIFPDGSVVLEVKDDGVGLRGSDIDNPKSLGILGIQERVGLLRGKVVWQGAPDKGTIVTVTIPYSNESNETSSHSR
jgi:signal transduction histidine kinase